LCNLFFQKLSYGCSFEQYKDWVHIRREGAQLPPCPNSPVIIPGTKILENQLRGKSDLAALSVSQAQKPAEDVVYVCNLTVNIGK